jgi:hypothetical protein
MRRQISTGYRKCSNRDQGVEDVAEETTMSRLDMLKDPLIRQVMKADGVRVSELSALMTKVAARLDGGDAGRRQPEVYSMDEIESRSDPRFEPSSRLLRMECSWTMH